MLYTAALIFPQFDPVVFSIGPVSLRWYALAYVAGLLTAIWYARLLVSSPALWDGKPASATTDQIDDLLLWATLGVIIGGRLGYVLFYNPAYFFSHPMQIVRTWDGGMSFHGGFLGVLIALYLYSRKHNISFAGLLDLAAVTGPIGLGLGRLANFVNGELFGRTSDVPWAMVFPGGGPLARHPSQLYEAFLEGLVLFLVLRFASHHRHMLSRPGALAGLFAIGYAASRIIVEFFREPDRQLGYFAGWLTMGMILSLPLLAAGVWLLARARRTP